MMSSGRRGGVGKRTLKGSVTGLVPTHISKSGAWEHHIRRHRSRVEAYKTGLTGAIWLAVGGGF